MAARIDGPGARFQLGQFGVVAAIALLLSIPEVILPSAESGLEVAIGQSAWARRSGGRSGGGSFRSPSRSSGGPSRSSGGSAGGSSGGSSGGISPNQSPTYAEPRRPSDYNSGGGYYNRGPVIVPVPIPIPGGGGYGPYNGYGQNNPNFNNPYPAQSNPNGVNPEGTTSPQGVPSPAATPPPSQPADAPPSGMDMLLGLVLLGVGTLLPVGAVIWLIKRFSKKAATGANAIENDIVTVSRVQVALLAEARTIQAELTTLSEQVDTSTAEGLLQLLQETALALLRSPENWSHVLGSSETVKTREAAEGLFNQVAIAERSKYTVETLTNVGGRVNRSTNYQVDLDKDPASYIVVTLLVGSTHDQPLFAEVRTPEQLKDVLKALASMPADHLLVFELLWTPQVESDSLTYDELLTEYTDMVQI